MSSTRPTLGTTGGQLHPVCPPRGRFHTESVLERAQRLARAAKLHSAIHEHDESEPVRQN